MKKDPGPNSFPPSSKDAALSMPTGADAEDLYDRHDVKPGDVSRRAIEREPLPYNPANDYDKYPSSSNAITFCGKDESGFASDSFDRGTRIDNAPTSYVCNTNQKLPLSQSQKSAETEEKLHKMSPPRRKGSSREEKSEKMSSFLKKDGSFNMSNSSSKKQEPDPPFDGNINALLEVCDICISLAYFVELWHNLLTVKSTLSTQEEEALICAHRKEIEDTMDIVREVCWDAFSI